MRKIFFILLVAFSFCFATCESNNKLEPIEKWVHGIWISEGNDTLNFISDGFLLYNSRPFFFKFMEDSLSLFPTESSNLNDTRYYRYKLSRKPKELKLYKFFTADSIKFLEK
jgi:hypothetical protein